MEFEYRISHEYGQRQLQLAAQLEAESQSAGQIYEYHNSLIDRYIDHHFIGDGMQSIARIIELQDRLLGNAEGAAVSISFYRGVIIGARVADMQGGELLLDSLPKAPIPYIEETTGDVFEDTRILRGLYIEKGREVYETSRSYHPLIESWTDSLVPDVTKQVYLKCGFGMMLHMINGAERIIRYEDAERALENCDWDLELIKLTDGQ